MAQGMVLYAARRRANSLRKLAALAQTDAYLWKYAADAAAQGEEPPSAVTDKATGFLESMKAGLNTPAGVGALGGAALGGVMGLASNGLLGGLAGAGIGAVGGGGIGYGVGKLTGTSSASDLYSDLKGRASKMFPGQAQ